MTKIEQLLETITECIREKRRWGPRFPTPFDLSKISWNVEGRRIELDLWEDGRIVKYDLLLDRVNEHGETSESGSDGSSVERPDDDN
jgi:hypothetical protein